jgi:hypothetical protein
MLSPKGTDKAPAQQDGQQSWLVAVDSFRGAVGGKIWPKFKFSCRSAHRVKVCFNIVIVD